MAKTNEDIMELAMEDYVSAMKDDAFVNRIEAGHSFGVNRIVAEVWNNFGIRTPLQSAGKEDAQKVIDELVHLFEELINWKDYEKYSDVNFGDDFDEDDELVEVFDEDDELIDVVDEDDELVEVFDDDDELVDNTGEEGF